MVGSRRECRLDYPERRQWIVLGESHQPMTEFVMTDQTVGHPRAQRRLGYTQLLGASRYV